MRNTTPSTPGPTPRPVAIIADGKLHPWPMTDEAKLRAAILTASRLFPTYTIVYMTPITEGPES